MPSQAGTGREPDAAPDALASSQEESAPTQRRKRLGLLFAGLAALVVVVLVAVLALTGGDDERGPRPSPGADTRPPASGEWLSGASGPEAYSGAFARWRGSDLEIVGSWADSNKGQTALWPLLPDGELSSWQGPVDMAIGAIDEGETWAEAADGAYDARWRESLTLLRDLWGDRESTVYVRFAHEMNGNWYPWSVDAGSTPDFVEAWKRFRSLQQEVFPESQLVFCVNRESVGAGIDWRKMFPGAEYVDVMGVDYYNNNPYVETQEEWDEAVWATDRYGAPTGIEGHLEFARSVGLPLAVPEWSGTATDGDSTLFFEQMHAFLTRNGGTGAGQVLYEIIFNVDGYDDNFILYPETLMPDSAETYQQLW